MVKWYNAVEYCNELSELNGLDKCYSGSGDNIVCDWSKNGYRLPTEAEWEYATRGGMYSRHYRYSGSDDIGYVAWYLANSSIVTHRVKMKAANELGLYDMSGNVEEWCWDWYKSSNMGGRDPRGPVSGTARITRGGSFMYSSCAVYYRKEYTPGMCNRDTGFRVVRSSRNWKN